MTRGCGPLIVSLVLWLVLFSPASADPREAGTASVKQPSKGTGEGDRHRIHPLPGAAPTYRSGAKAAGIESPDSPLTQAPTADSTPVKVETIYPTGFVVIGALPPSDPNSNLTPPRSHPASGLKEKVEEQYPDGVNLPVQDGGDPALPITPLLTDGQKAAPGTGSPAVAFQDCDATTCGQPPDTDMAVGPDHIMTDYNTWYKIYNKLGTLLTQGSLVDVFNAAGMAICGAPESPTTWLSDPNLHYDEENSRWVLTMLRIRNSGTDGTLCVCASQTAVPTGLWWGFETNYIASTLPDYPHLGVGQDAVFLGTNDFAPAYINSKVTAFHPKANLYTGDAVTVYRATLSNSGYTPQPAERHGFAVPQWPPSGTAHYIMAANGTTGVGQVFRWTYPTNTGILQFVNEPGIAYPGATVDPAGATYTQGPIDSSDFRFMDAELRWPKLWTARAGASGGFDIVQWAELNLVTGTPAVVQTSNYGIASSHLWMPDLTVDKNNDFATGFTLAAPVTPQFVSAYLAGRENTDPANTLLGPVKSVDGTVIYTGFVQNGSYRWGDYLGMVIDPNGCDIWFNGMYSATQSATFKTATYVQKFKFPGCSAGPTRIADLDKGRYFCADTVVGSITDTDTAGTPTNAQYHSTTGGAVAATISGGPYTFGVTSKTIAQLGASDGDDIWLTFDGSSSSGPFASAPSTLDCSLEVCVYQIDSLTGGCDNDGYHDEGEVLNYNVAIANLEAFDLPGPFQATLRPKVADPNVTMVNATTYFPALTSNTFTYGDPPLAARYSKPIGTSPCPATIQWEIVSIQSLDNSFWSTGCPIGSNEVTVTTNADFNVTGTTWSESFDLASFPPTDWAETDVSGNGTWARATGTVHPSGYFPHSGAGLAYFNSWTVNPGVSTRLHRTRSDDLTTFAGAFTTFWMFHDNQYSNPDTIQVQASTDNGANWTSIGSPIYRYDGSANVWTQHSVDVSAFTGPGFGNVRIGLLALGQFGNDMHIDDVALNVGTLFCEPSVCSPAPNLVYDQFAFDDVGCNNDGFLDPGEYGEVSIYLANTGNDWALGTTATLSCPTCDTLFGAGKVQICDSTGTYGDIPYGTPYVYAPAVNGFTVGLASTLSCPAALSSIPFVVTVQATNPYAVVIAAPVDIGAERVNSPSANGNTYEEHFTIQPETSGAGGRYGFTGAWTTSADSELNPVAISSTCPGTDGDGSACLSASANNTTRTMDHLFSTIGATTNVVMTWEWNVGLLLTNGYLRLYYSPTGLAGPWSQLVNDPGTDTSPASDWNCWGGSLYYTILAQYGQTAADAILNNQNFALRFEIRHATGQARRAHIDNVILRNYSYQCATTTCTGTCLGPPPVPDGLWVPGQPLKVVKNGGNVDFTWDAGTCTANNYMALWGNLSSLSLVAGVTEGTVTLGNCGLGTTGQAVNKATPAVGAGQCYFVVMNGNVGAQFGRHGNNSLGNERILAGVTGPPPLCFGASTKNITRTTCLTPLVDPSSSGPPRSRVKAQEKRDGVLTSCCGGTPTRRVPAGAHPVKD